MSRVTLDPVARAKGPKKGGCLASGLITLVILLFAATMVTVIIAVGIWPGEAKLTAPLLCPEDQQDAFVVTDTYQVQPGETSTTFTLYCMGERGDITDVGFGRPFALLTAFHLAIIVAIVVLLGLLGRLARGGRSAAGEPSSTGPPAPQAAPDGPPPPGAPWTTDAPGGSSSRSENETDFEPPGPIIS